MAETINIKCPDCGKVLQVKYVPGIEDKVLRCIVCRRVHSFKDFKRAMDGWKDGCTEYDAGSGSIPLRHGEPSMNIVPGRLIRNDGSFTVFNLVKGINVIGRKATSSTATIQIDTAPSKKMSRNHLQIDVKMVTGKGLVHYLSLCKKDINATYINGTQLFFGDTVILNDGDVLTLPDATLKFTIPDEEGTEL